MTPTHDIPVTQVVRTRWGSLHPGEQRVCDVVLQRPDWVLEATTAQVAAAADVSTATVVRTAQRLGYRGFPHLRVLLARDLGASTGQAPPEVGSDAEGVRAFFGAVGAATESMTALLDDERVSEAVGLLCSAGRILVCGGGVSAPVALDIAMRLAAIGRPAEAPADHLDQCIRARLLGPGDLCVVVSGTGATSATLAVARAAHRAGAPVLSLTAFSDSPLASLATVDLVSATGAGMKGELATTFRVPQLILGNALVAAVAARDPEGARAARAMVLEVVAPELTDRE